MQCVPFFTDNLKPKKPIDLTTLKGKEDDMFEEIASDEDDNDEDEDDEDADPEEEEEEEDDEYMEDEANSSTASTLPYPSPTAAPASSTQVPTPDPYFTHFDPRLEHQAYKDAQQRLEEMHREKVTKVNKYTSTLLYPRPILHSLRPPQVTLY